MPSCLIPVSELRKVAISDWPGHVLLIEEGRTNLWIPLGDIFQISLGSQNSIEFWVNPGESGGLGPSVSVENDLIQLRQSFGKTIEPSSSSCQRALADARHHISTPLSTPLPSLLSSLPAGSHGHNQNDWKLQPMIFTNLFVNLPISILKFKKPFPFTVSEVWWPPHGQQNGYGNPRPSNFLIFSITSSTLFACTLGWIQTFPVPAWAPSPFPFMPLPKLVPKNKTNKTSKFLRFFQHTFWNTPLKPFTQPGYKGDSFHKRLGGIARGVWYLSGEKLLLELDRNVQNLSLVSSSSIFMFFFWYSFHTTGTSTHHNQQKKLACYILSSTSTFTIILHPKNWTMSWFWQMAILNHQVQVSACAQAGVIGDQSRAPGASWVFPNSMSTLEKMIRIHIPETSEIWRSVLTNTYK